MNLKKTFTLIELIVVVSILAILSVTVMLTLTKWISGSRNATRVSDLNTISKALISEYSMNIGNYPDPGKAINIYDLSGNLIAKEGLFDESVWLKVGQVLPKLPKDPSGTPNDGYYGYTSIHKQKGFELIAYLEDVKLLGYTNQIKAELLGRVVYVLTNHDLIQQEYKKIDVFSYIHKNLGTLNTTILNTGGYIKVNTTNITGETVNDINILGADIGGGTYEVAPVVEVSGGTVNVNDLLVAIPADTVTTNTNTVNNTDIWNWTDDQLRNIFSSSSLFTQNWGTNNCDPNNITINRTKFSGGSIGDYTLQANTIYMVPDGIYNMSQNLIFGGDCIALIGQSKDGVIFSGNSIYIYGSSKNNIITNLDSYFILIYGGSNTVKDVKGNRINLAFTTSKNNYLENIEVNSIGVLYFSSKNIFKNIFIRETNNVFDGNINISASGNYFENITGKMIYLSDYLGKFSTNNYFKNFNFKNITVAAGINNTFTNGIIDCKFGSINYGGISLRDANYNVFNKIYIRNCNVSSSYSITTNYYGYSVSHNNDYNIFTNLIIYNSNLPYIHSTGNIFHNILIFNNNGAGFSVYGKNNSLNNILGLTNIGFTIGGEKAILNNMHITSDLPYVYFYSNNNILHNIFLHSAKYPTVGRLFTISNSAGNIYYGKLKAYIISVIVTGATSPHPDTGWGPGVLDTTPVTINCDILANPIATDGTKMFTGDNCNFVKYNPDFSGKDIQTIIFGSNVPKQVQPYIRSGDKLVPWGQEGVDWDPNKYIGQW